MTYEQKHLKFKIFAFLYYPMQYIIIRCLVLGVALQPSLIDFYNGFNIKGIMTVVIDFISHLDNVMTAEHYLFIIVNIIPYLIKLLWACRNIIIYIFVLIQFVNFIIYTIEINTYKADDKNVVTIRIGQPGSGKSSSGGFEAVALAEKMWQELKYKFWEYKSLIGKWKKEKNKAKIKEWQEIKDSYYYYITNDCIPCLWSNIPLQANGQKSSILTYQHALQEKKIPYYSVLLFDEVGSIFTVAMSKDKPLTVSDFYRLCRHFGDYRIICTEQDPENIFIDVRRVVAQNIYMLSQKWTNKPLILVCLFAILKKICMQYTKGNKKLAQFMRFLRTAISFVGARKYKYVVQQNTELQEIEQRQKIKKYYLPPHLNYQYDDRTYKNLYLCKNKGIEAKIFKTLSLENTADNKKKYLKSA